MDGFTFTHEARAARPECATCPRFEQGIFVPPQIHAPQGSPLVLLESPGQDENERGVPAVGRAGMMLNTLLEHAGTGRARVNVVNTVMCGTPDTNVTPTPTEIACCASLVSRAIEVAQPSVVLAMGTIAAYRAIGLAKGLAKFRGGVRTFDKPISLGKVKMLGPQRYKTGERAGELKWAKREIIVPPMPCPTVITYHPAELVRTGGINWPFVIADIKRALTIHARKPLVEVASRELRIKLKRGSSLAPYLESSKLTMDVETDPETRRMKMIGVAPDPYHVRVFKPTAEVFEALGKWMSDPTHTFVAHNAAFDLAILHEHGVPFAGHVWDTMHAAAFERPDIRADKKPLGEDAGAGWDRLHALDVVASRMSKLEYWNWKEEFRGDKLDEWTYCAFDTATESYLERVLRKRLETSGQLPHFESTLMPLVPILSGMEREGVQVDQRRLETLVEKQRRVVRDLEAHVRATIPVENPNSLPQLREYLFKTLRLKPTSRTKAGTPKLDRAAIDELARRYPSCEPLLVKMQLNHAQKMLSAYYERILRELDGNGRWHPQYNLSGTDFGRLSSDAQQFPRAKGDDDFTCRIGVPGCQCSRIRSIFIHDQGDWGMLAADYSQIELIIVALISRETWMIDALLEGRDLHAEMARIMSRYVGHEMTRDDGKKANHTTSYVGTWVTIQKSFGCSEEQAHKLEHAVRAARPAMVAWWNTLLATVRRNGGHLVNPFGRKMVFSPGRNGDYELSKLAAFMGQSTAGDVIYGAMLRAHRAGLKLRFQVHDELVTSARSESEIETLRECMEWAVRELGWTFKCEIGLGRSWLAAKRKSAKVHP